MKFPSIPLMKQSSNAALEADKKKAKALLDKLLASLRNKSK
jgi:hypothetical protein